MTKAKIQDHRPRPYTIIEDIVLESHLTSLQKLVLIVLQKYAGKQSSAWPGVETLARCSSCSSRQIRRIIKELQEVGLLNIEHRPGQSSIYHIPEYRLFKNRLCGVWSTPDTMSAPDNIAGVQPATHDTVSPQPGQDDRGGMTSCPVTPDTMSSKQYQEQYQGRTLSPRDPADKPPPDPERENFFDHDLIVEWGQCFSLNHRPVSEKELRAMDWMIYASDNNQLGQINSPIGYLKTITQKGHPLNFPSFQERKQKNQTQVQYHFSAEQQWQNMNKVNKIFFYEDAKERGVGDDQLEIEAFKIFQASIQDEQNTPLECPSVKPPIKSPPTPQVSPC